MENESIFQIWQQVLDALEAAKEEPSCLLWLKQAAPKALTDDTLLLDVTTKLAKERIEEKYLTKVEDCLAKICHRPVKAIVEVSQGKKEQNLFPEGETAAATQAEKTPAAIRKEEWQSNLSPKYEFENFVVGNSNRIAHNAALAVANNPGNTFNPFFLYSDSGLGKTHLMNAIGNRILKNHPEMKVLYISSETFTNEMIAALGQNKMQSFKDKYRHIDVLIIDDIQFLRGKESIQEEFFHTFNTLKEANKQIIISSDRPPAELDRLEDRLISRFASGLSEPIYHPDPETRIAILQNMAEKDHLEFPEEVLRLIADNVVTNIRELEGAYTKVRFQAEITGQPLTLELAREALKDLNLTNGPAKVITPEAIQQKVAARFKIRPEDLKAKTRARPVAYPRQIAMYLTRELTELSLPKIGEFYGGRDHTTVLHACDKMASEKKDNPDLERQLQELVAELKK